jgi:hypothetical protein
VLVAILELGNDQDKVEVQSSVGDVERASISVSWHVGVNTGIMQHVCTDHVKYTHLTYIRMKHLILWNQFT